MPTEPKGIWNYHPELPLANTSIFRWPVDFGSLTRWLLKNWLSLSERVMLLLIAFAVWQWLYPPLEASRTLAFGWIAQTYLINLGLMLASAGGLHWYFYRRRGQGLRLKFDARDQARSNRAFLFADQVRDNMFYSLVSGVAFWTLFQVVTLWMMANEIIPTLSFADGPVLFIALIVLMPVWSAFHFYWVHRLLHQPFFYKRFHALHHRNINIGPWSGLSMHPVEHFLYFTTICIHWIVASHPVHVIYHLLYQSPGAAMTHTGYEDLLIRDKRRLALGTFYHTLHHRFFECNYGNQEMPWDRWFGTFHDGSDAATEATRARKKKMYAGKEAANG